MIKNIIFDLGNVLLKFQPNEFLLRFTDDVKYIDQFVPKIFRSTVWMDLDRGILSLENAKTNFIKETFTFIENKYNIFSLFDGQIISGYEKTIKPEKEIYIKLLNKYHLIPEESLFIDDVLFFLKPAKKLGMKTIWNQPETDLREELRKFNITI